MNISEFTTTNMNATDFNNALAQFKQERGIEKVIGFGGGAELQQDGLLNQAMQPFQSTIDQVMAEEIEKTLIRLADYRVAILTGGTNGGIPALAARTAKKHGFATIGVTPYTGVKHSLNNDILDYRIVVEPVCEPSCWGDETPTFCKLIDALVVYGGSAGTGVEVMHLLKINEARLKAGLPMKFIVPIHGSGGTADLVPYMPTKLAVKAACLPRKPITNGLAAAEFLENHLNLFDYTYLENPKTGIR